MFQQLNENGGFYVAQIMGVLFISGLIHLVRLARVILTYRPLFGKESVYDLHLSIFQQVCHLSKLLIVTFNNSYVCWGPRGSNQTVPEEPHSHCSH